MELISKCPRIAHAADVRPCDLGIRLSARHRGRATGPVCDRARCRGDFRDHQVVGGSRPDRCWHVQKRRTNMEWLHLAASLSLGLKISAHRDCPGGNVVSRWHVRAVIATVLRAVAFTWLSGRVDRLRGGAVTAYSVKMTQCRDGGSSTIAASELSGWAEYTARMRSRHADLLPAVLIGGVPLPGFSRSRNFRSALRASR